MRIYRVPVVIVSTLSRRGPERREISVTVIAATARSAQKKVAARYPRALHVGTPYLEGNA